MAPPPMNTNYLHWFYIICQSDSLRQAGQTLGVAPSTLSRLLIRLEEDAGLPLIDRSQKGFVLTDAGNAYLAYAQRILGIERHMYTALINGQESLPEVLRIGAGVISIKHLAAIYPQLMTAFPRLHLTAREGHTYSLLPMLKEKKIDTILGSLDHLQAPGEKIALLYRNELALAVPRYLISSPLTDQWKDFSAVTPELMRRLRDIPFLRHSRNSSIGRVTDRIFQEMHFSPLYVSIFENADFLNTLAKTGQYAFLTFAAHAEKFPKCKLLPLTDPAYIYTVALFREDYELTPVDQTLIHLLATCPPPTVQGEFYPNGLTRSLTSEVIK